MRIKILIHVVCCVLAFSTQVLALDEPPQLHFVVKEFVVEGDSPISDAKTQSILKKYTGDHYGLEGLREAAGALEMEFRKQGYSFYRVTLVPQKLKDGIIKLQISEFKIERITIEGNEHYNVNNIMNSLPSLELGKASNTAVLSRALNMANALPSKKLKLQFAESEAGGSIEAKINVIDIDPDYWFTALNNTGTDETGEWRLTGGYQFTNLFNRDNQLALSYTFSPNDFGAVKQYGAFYKIPFYKSGSQFSILLARSDVDSGVVAQNFAVKGAGTILLLRYVKTLLQRGAYKQEFEFGIDNKLFDNDVTFAGLPTIGDGKVLTRPVSLGYTGSWIRAGSSIDFNVAGFMNISGGSKNTDSDYDNVRLGAIADWSAVYYGFNYNQVIAQNWFFRLKILGQQSSDLLISAEQFGIGGIYSVRGFEERTLLGDSGYQTNLELWAPGITSWNIRPLVFFDLGHVEINDPLPGETPEHDISSAGAGLRWNRENQLSLVADVAYVLDGDEFIPQSTEKGNVRGHINLYYRF